MPGEGDPDADVLLVGEAPGANEDLEGRPFVGRARASCSTSCWPRPGWRAATCSSPTWSRRARRATATRRAAEVAHHLPWLEQQLALIRPRVVIPVGRHALAHFAPGRKITEVHGAPLEHGGRRLVPWYHPAAALRSPRLRETLVADAQALPAILASA